MPTVGAARGDSSMDSASEGDGTTTAEMGYTMMSPKMSPKMSSKMSSRASSSPTLATTSAATSPPATRPISSSSPDSLEVLRHDCAHVLAEAVQSLYPSAKLGFGPATEDGFYYDFEQAEPFTPDCFGALEEKMREIITRAAPFEREEWERATAHKYFTERGEHLKAEHVLSLPEGETITVYRQGDWLDLCRGPHGVGTGDVGMAFKLLGVSGTVWKGGVKKLQRLRGTCWQTDEELSAYLSRLERARQSDHRRLGQGLYHFQEEAAGSAFWHEGGFAIYRACERYIRGRLAREGYREVRTPQLIDRRLWERSGHWQKFREHMYTISEQDEGADGAKRIFALKPMNCPGHVQIFKQSLVSYRELPLRLSEFGLVHRNEPSGALHGLMRARAFTQDDGHIFCREDQIIEETRRFCVLLQSIYADFGFNDLSVKFSDRPAERAGDDALWDKAESALREASLAAGLDYSINSGEGAFYGPKLEFVLRDGLGRDWQCGTWQVDFVLPRRLDASYIDERGERQHPVLLHRAILGSLERFIGILMEHYLGALPLWLAPVQVVVATITNKSDAYAEECARGFRAAGLRVSLDCRAAKIGYKIREHSSRKVPVIAVVGEQESAGKLVALRRFGVASSPSDGNSSTNKVNKVVSKFTGVSGQLPLSAAITALRLESALPGGVIDE